jgi:tetratricopeptide (TPR) repeat protein
MFTINIYLKLALIAVGFIGGAVLTSTMGFWYAFPLWLMGFILLASYIFLGTVQSGAQLIQDGEYDAAEKRLSLTLFPKFLYITNKAFYYIMQGTLSSQKGDQKTAEDYFNTALGLKLPSDNEKAMVLMQLANIKASKNNWTAATNYFNKAKKLKITQSEIKSQLEYFEKALTNNKGQMKAARSMGKQGMQMMRGGGSGGKRRRPKMR